MPRRVRGCLDCDKGALYASRNAPEITRRAHRRRRIAHRRSSRPLWCCQTVVPSGKLRGAFAPDGSHVPPSATSVCRKEEPGVFVAASSECFGNLSLDGVLQRLVDLEYNHIEIAVHEDGGQLKPSDVLANLDDVIAICRETYRLTISGYSVDIQAEGELYYEQFAACCRLAKATKVVTLTVPAAELGTPFNAEIERLQRLTAIATADGVMVGIKTETGRITQDPDTAVVLCDNVKGLGITLDPSHYIYGPHAGGNYDQLMKHVLNTHLRDTTKDRLQVRVGQGQVEYGRLITQLAKHHYNRALTVVITEMPEVDHAAEMRKMRLLLESLL